MKKVVKPTASCLKREKNKSPKKNQVKIDYRRWIVATKIEMNLLVIYSGLSLQKYFLVL